MLFIRKIFFSAIILIIFLVFIELFFRILAPKTMGSLHTSWGQSVVRNSNGFVDYEHEVKNKNDMFRILILGDSQGAGAGVFSFKDIFPSKIEEYLNKGLNKKKFEVINISKSAWSTGDQIAALQRLGLKYEPDLIFLAFFHNDVPFLNGLDSARKKNKTVFSLVRLFLANMSKYSSLMGFTLSRYDKFLESNSIKERYGDALEKNYSMRGWELAKLELDVLDSISRAKNIHLLIGFLPLLQDLDNYPLKNASKKLMKYCETRNISCIDIFKHGFENKDETLLSVLYPDIHYNEKGHEIIAKTIFEKLKPLKGYLNINKFHKGLNLSELIGEFKLLKQLDNNFLKQKNKNFKSSLLNKVFSKEYQFQRKSKKLLITKKWRKKGSNEIFIQTNILEEKGKLLKTVNNIENKELFDKKDNFRFEDRIKEESWENGFKLTNNSIVPTWIKNKSLNPLINHNITSLNPLIYDFKYQYSSPLKFERDYLVKKNMYTNIKNIKPLATALNFFYLWNGYFNSLVDYSINNSPRIIFIRTLEIIYKKNKEFDKRKELIKEFPNYFGKRFVNGELS